MAIEKMYQRTKTYKVEVRQGWGKDNLGLNRYYGEFLQNGEVTVSIPRDNREYEKYKITDYNTGEKWEYDFGKLHGRAVIPFRVKVYFGKCDYVSVGYQMRKDGSFYYGSMKCFRKETNKTYERSEFARLHEQTMKCPEADSLKYGWLLPDETKEAIEAEMKEATSGKYRFEIEWDMI